MDELCPECKSVLLMTLTPDLTHYARLDCVRCNKFIKWLKSPENADKRTSTSKYSIRKILSFHNMEKEICFFCPRNKEQLGECETMTIDHINELSDGGVDELGNLQILCSACHKMKNWMRLYVNKHLKKYYDTK